MSQKTNIKPYDLRLINVATLTGKVPDGKSAIEVRRDCNIKIYVEGFIGFVVSRFGSKKNYSIWEDGARAYWGKDYEKKLLKGRSEKMKRPKNR